MDHDVTNRNRFLGVQFNVIFINVEIKGSLDEMGLRVKADIFWWDWNIP